MHRLVFYNLIFFHLISFSVKAQWNQTKGPCGANVTSILSVGQIILAGTETNVYISSKDIYSWSVHLNDFNDISGDYITSIVTDGTYIYAGTLANKLAVSDDNGENWMWLGNGLAAQQINEMSIIGDTLLLGTNIGVFSAFKKNGIWDTNDPGWVIRNSGLNDKFIYTLTTIGSTIYVGTQNGVYNSTDYGNSWTTINNGMSGYEPKSRVKTIIKYGTKIFAGTEGGIYVTTDQGQNWIARNIGLSNLRCNALAVYGSRLFAGTDGGIFVTTDDGVSWNLLENGSAQSRINTLYMNGSILYSGTDVGIFVSTDGGDNWHAINKGMISATVNSFASQGSHFFAGSVNNGVYLSTDFGSNWSAINIGLYKKITSLAMDSANLYAGTNGGGISITKDIGKTWKNITVSQDGRFILSAGSKLYVGGMTYRDKYSEIKGGVSLSTNHGTDWNRITPDSIRDISSITIADSMLYAINPFGGAYLSTNEGGTWSVVLNKNASSNAISSLVVRSNVVFASYAGTVYSSVDNAASWINAHSGLENAVYCLFVDSSSNTLFCGSYGSDGVYLFDDINKKWFSISNKSFPDDCYIQALTVYDKYLFAGTNYGIWRISLSEITSIKKTTQTFAYQYQLKQNYPNPFNSSTQIEFSIPDNSFVTVRMYNVLGKEIATLINDNKGKGTYTVSWDAHDFSSGVYFCRLKAGSFEITKKVILLK